MCAVLFDDGINELLCRGPPAQQADAPLELRHQGDGIAEQVSPLDGCVPHLPTGKFPKRQHRNTTKVRFQVQAGKADHWGNGLRRNTKGKYCATSPHLTPLERYTGTFPGLELRGLRAGERGGRRRRGGEEKERYYFDMY